MVRFGDAHFNGKVSINGQLTLNGHRVLESDDSSSQQHGDFLDTVLQLRTDMQSLEDVVRDIQIEITHAETSPDSKGRSGCVDVAAAIADAIAESEIRMRNCVRDATRDLAHCPKEDACSATTGEGARKSKKENQLREDVASFMEDTRHDMIEYCDASWRRHRRSAIGQRQPPSSGTRATPSSAPGSMTCAQISRS